VGFGPVCIFRRRAHVSAGLLETDERYRWQNTYGDRQSGDAGGHTKNAFRSREAIFMSRDDESF
jgi:hypothetical protein